MGDLAKLIKKAKKEYAKIACPAHDWNHIHNVLDNANRIARSEDADLAIVLPAVVLHDLGRVGGNEKTHSLNTSLAARFLKQAGYANGECSAIIRCIRAHSVEGKQKPFSLDAKVLFDADKLDSYGFIGVARFFTLCGEEGVGLHEGAKRAVAKITSLDKVGGFYTKTGEKLGFGKAKQAFLFYYFLCKELGLEKEKFRLEKILAKKVGKIKARLLLKTAEAALH